MFETPLTTIPDTSDQPSVSEQLAVQNTDSAVASVDLLAVAISRFGQWRASAAALVERYRSVAFDLTTTKGYAELAPLARAAQVSTLDTLRAMHATAVAAEAAQVLADDAIADSEEAKLAAAAMACHISVNLLSDAYSAPERVVMLRRMRDASNVFYGLAVQTGCHPFIEFTGLMNEYIKVCERAHENGIDFANCSKHSGRTLPMESFEVGYVNEKLECIFTGRIMIAGG